MLVEDLFKIEGEGAYFLVNTSDGSVLIDTGTYYAQVDEQHKVMLEKATGPIRKIIATYFHSDHVGGLPRWKDHIGTSEIELIGHHRHVYPGSDYEFELGGVRFVVIDWSLA